MSCEDLGVPLPNPDNFIQRAGQALVTGKYQNGLPYSIEALFLYTTCKHMQDADGEKHMWVLMGITARLALRMGYHRDPRALSKITPFEGEMRRRIFSQVEVMDLLLSFQAGLPPVIQEDECDTEAPSNLLDTDFDEDCKTLPSSRPTSDPTTMLYYCEKSRMARLLRRAVRHALSLKNPSFEETMKIDQDLRNAHLLVPDSLRMKPLGSALVDQTFVILHRLNLEILYLRSTCVLHRKYLTQERSNPRFKISRETCLAAALQILSHQAELHFACQPGGQLYNDRWMLTSSLITYDFLLAVMIICLELYESRDATDVDLHIRIQQYNAVKLAQEIWMSRSSLSREARRAITVIASLLSRVKDPSAETARDITQEQAVTETSKQLGIGANHSPLGALDPASSSDGFYQGQYLDSVFGESDNIDWVSFC